MARVASDAGTSGSRGSPTGPHQRFTAALTGIGFGSTNSALKRGVNASWILSATGMSSAFTARDQLLDLPPDQVGGH